jgi:hypothetical protein
MMIKKLKTILLNYSGLFIVSFILPFKSLYAADGMMDLLKSAGGKAGYGPADTDTIPGLIGTIVSIAIGFVGAIFFILVIYSGIQWMTAGGNDEKVKKARSRLVNAIIGLAVTVSAYFITKLISDLAIG